ncbi:hypothetical protein [Nocardiopsis rhodophaea]|uniref:hypothetical protein n=1 Tax=Nocardiopsis rhodophaea TaxID=280238 RepID=UPI0031E13359
MSEESPEPTQALVGRIVNSTHPPALWEVLSALDILRLELDAATKRVEQERRRLPGLKRALTVTKTEAFMSDPSSTVKEREFRAMAAAADAQCEVDICEELIKAGREAVDTIEKQMSSIQSMGAAIREEMRALGGFGGAA